MGFHLMTPKKQEHQNCLESIVPALCSQQPRPVGDNCRSHGGTKKERPGDRNPQTSACSNRTLPLLHSAFCTLKKSCAAKEFWSPPRETQSDWKVHYLFIASFYWMCYFKYELTSIPFNSSTSRGSSVDDVVAVRKSFDICKFKEWLFY